MTPNAIEILIHCHVSPTPHPRKDAPAVADELKAMCACGLIEPAGQIDRYRTTARGAAHIEQLCNLQWPVQAWVGADGRIISAESLGR